MSKDLSRIAGKISKLKKDIAQTKDEIGEIKDKVLGNGEDNAESKIYVHAKLCLYCDHPVTCQAKITKGCHNSCIKLYRERDKAGIVRILR